MKKIKILNKQTVLKEMLGKLVYGWTIDWRLERLIEMKRMEYLGQEDRDIKKCVCMCKIVQSDGKLFPPDKKPCVLAKYPTRQSIVENLCMKALSLYNMGFTEPKFCFYWRSDNKIVELVE